MRSPLSMYAQATTALNRSVTSLDMLDISLKFKVIPFFKINVLSHKKLNFLLVALLKGK